MMRRAILLALAVTCHAQGEQDAVPPVARATGRLRLLFAGSSITCGTGAPSYAASFVPRAASRLEAAAGIPVDALNLCYGGTASLAQYLSLRDEGLPMRPHAVVWEPGTLDGLSAAPALPAIEAGIRAVRAAGLPLILIYPATQYQAVPRDAVARLARHYGVSLADIPRAAAQRGLKLRAVAPDGVHPNQPGQDLMTAELSRLFESGALTSQPAPLPPRLLAPSLDAARYLPAVDLLPGMEPARPSRFRPAGSGVQCPDQCEGTLAADGGLLAILFTFGRVPERFEYQMGNGAWRRLDARHRWLVSHLLYNGLAPERHIVRFRMSAGAVDGFISMPR
ncbi:MAG: SGNH/GDSL hydrolase family protein [Acidobacteria bacterium]|nr:SGNH/GDSL hydrolase family protein [Acidobacteriota bacterium]